MESNWREIVNRLQKQKMSNVTEDIYESEIINCLLLLGWKETNGSFERQKEIPIGNNNSMRIDLLLKKDGHAILPIEIKRPTNVCTERQEAQLFSYMRQLKLPVGMYIGECIRLYFESSNYDKPIQIIEAKIDPCNNNGVILCKLLEYQNISSEQLLSFCNDLCEKQEKYSMLKKELDLFFTNGEENIKNLIKQHFGLASSTYSDMLDSYRIKVDNITDDNSVSLQEKQTKFISDNSSDIIKRKSQNNTQYSIDGTNFMGKGRFVLHIVQQYIKDNPNISFQTLSSVFPAELAKPTTLQVVQHRDKAMNYQSLHKDSVNRYFFDTPICLNDGSTIVVNSQWGEPHFSSSILPVIKRLYKVYSK